MNCCSWSMCVLQKNWWTGEQPKEELFLICDDDLLPLMDLRPSRTLRDRWRTEGETLCTLRWWSVAADGSPSFKDTSGQVENWRRNCFYFPMVICCRWWISVLQGHLWTGGERKEKLFLLCDDNLLPLMDIRPSRTFSHRSRTQAATYCNLGWICVSVIRCQYAVQHCN